MKNLNNKKNPFYKNGKLFFGLLTLLFVFLGSGLTWARTQRSVVRPFSAPESGSLSSAPLDPPYSRLRHVKLKPEVPGFFDPALPPDISAVPSKSKTLNLISKLTPVRSQQKRGTCSIFSATAMLEAMMTLKYDWDQRQDYSEEWLDYVVQRSKTEGGSDSLTNFSMITQYGVPFESTLPYIGQDWESINDSPLANERCSKFSGRILKSCLNGHRDPVLLTLSDQELLQSGSEHYDPELVKARAQAKELKDKFLDQVQEDYFVQSKTEIKKLLARGIPVTLDIDFFYGAWNHRETQELGLDRDMDSWSQGIVGYPESKSKDAKVSRTKPAGHSVLLVGYDDNRVVTTHVQMQDGSYKDFSYKGVYYFKNSWGTDSFGVNTEIDGQTVPGYGIITQKYANEYGAFFKYPL